jgi:hypothetical protein
MHTVVGFLVEPLLSGSLTLHRQLEVRAEPFGRYELQDCLIGSRNLVTKLGQPVVRETVILSSPDSPLLRSARRVLALALRWRRPA